MRVSQGPVCVWMSAPLIIWGHVFRNNWKIGQLLQMDLNETATALLFSKAFLKKCEVSCRPQVRFPVQLCLVWALARF